MRRRLTGLAALALLCAITACQPTFAEGGTLEAEVDGPMVRLTWPEVTPLNENAPVVEFVLRVDGAEVSRPAGWTQGCILSGLDPEVTYELTVVAVDSVGRLSEPLSAAVTTGPEPGESW